ncbi:ribbon-helix-helix protein, CopG family [Salibacterium halotolerans]|uniref:CopG family transcriptional regulator / antitoxin EndoAI n=1 Tax=Salibacterium halotolerans TaxID=1884432 RepID=A0A1I5XF93_9BACI|nr:ribbon-helix-helix protein, CopG family [Salibacterium halotolerans]SFQ30630.1 CopG family transcriptional regulator / antitoxin EndoAI [Salibacterium halotolerans]
MHQSSTKQIKVSLPEYLLNELDQMVEEDNTDRHDFIYQAAEFYLRERRKRRNRESMQQGYLEMANINLHIASESFLAEEEAENSVDNRLVSGV